jgi:hypothetical protein
MRVSPIDGVRCIASTQHLPTTANAPESTHPERGPAWLAAVLLTLCAGKRNGTQKVGRPAGRHPRPVKPLGRSSIISSRRATSKPIVACGGASDRTHAGVTVRVVAGSDVPLRVRRARFEVRRVRIRDDQEGLANAPFECV